MMAHIGIIFFYRQNHNRPQAATSTGVRTLTSWLWVHQPRAGDDGAEGDDGDEGDEDVHQHRAAILGSREKHVNLGDSVVIICELRCSIVTNFVHDHQIIIFILFKCLLELLCLLSFQIDFLFWPVA